MLIFGELSEWSKVQHSKSCYFLQKLNIYYTEAYRSGHNELHSKSCGELSVSSSRNRVTMRVLPGSKN